MKIFIVRLFFLINSAFAASEIFCEYKLIDWLDDYAEKCEVITIDFMPAVDGDTTIESVNGYHLNEYGNGDVMTLSIKFIVVEKMPLDLTKFFENLVELEVSYTNLKTISGDDLQEYGNLTTLNLSGNLLTTLPSGLFDNTPNLEYIDFSFNRIKYIDPDIFDAVNNLNRAFFNYNICTGSDPVFGNSRNEVQYTVEKYLFEHCKPKDEK